MKLIGLALAGACVLAAAPASALAQAPPNDNYLESLRVNQPGAELPRATTLRDLQDTTNATVQADLFAPGGSGGGPAEPTQCGASGYGKTIWYDIYPDRPVIARVTVNGNGFDPVIGIVEFDARTAVPRDFACTDRLSFTNEVLEIPLERGRAYSVQVGGFNNTGGGTETLFDFLRLPELRANATLRARPTSSGIRVDRLIVDAPRGSRIEVRCSRGCRRQVRNASTGGSRLRTGAAARRAGPRAEAARRISFSRLRGARLSRGTSLEIRVTQPGFIGRYFKYAIGRGAFRRTDRCLEPGSSAPRRRCG